MKKFIVDSITFYLILISSAELRAGVTQDLTQKVNLEEFMKQHKFYTRSNIKYLEQGDIIVSSDVETDSTKINQKLDMYVAGLHSKNCADTISTLNQYENYNKMIPFIEKSSYDEKNQLIHFFLSGEPYLSLKFLLETKLERIKSTGIFPFVMGAGMFSGLAGHLYVVEFNEGSRCLYYAKADWYGKKTDYPDFAVELLADGIGKTGLKKLFEVSGHKTK